MAENDNGLSEVKSRIKRARKYVEDWHSNITRWRKLYNQEHYLNVPKAREIQYSDPTFINTVDLSVGIMLANDMRWHAFGSTVTPSEQFDTGKIEKLLSGTWEANNIREQRLLKYDLFLNFNRDGGGIIYSVVNPYIKYKDVTVQRNGQDMTKHKFSEVPILTSVIDPLKFLCLPGGPKRWLLMGIEEKRSILDVEATYGESEATRRKGLGIEDKARVTGLVSNIWDYTPDPTDPTHLIVRNTVLFDGIAIKGPEPMVGYEDLPYDIQFYKPVGDESASWQNIMFPLESSVNLLERSFNRRAYQIDVFTGLPLIIKTQPGRRTSIDAGLYQSISISPDEDIVFPTWPGTAPDVQMQIDFLRSRIQQSGFSDIMFGTGPSQIAGYAISQLSDQNRIRLEQPIQHMELLLTMWAKKTLKLLSFFAKDSIISVYGTQKGTNYSEEIDTEDFSGYSVRAEIRPTFPNEQSRKVAMATQSKGILSMYTIRERYYDIQQPEDEERRALLEATMHHPVALQYAIISELQAIAEDPDHPDQKAAALTLQSLTNGGVSNPVGRPDEGVKPTQFSGTPSPTGLPTSQEMGGAPAGQSEADRQTAMANEAPTLMR